MTKQKGKAYNRDMKTNFDLAMQTIVNGVKKGERLLLHSCCAPCSSACLLRLSKAFEITVLYYNPNIDDPAEYEKRKAEQKRFLSETGLAKFLDCDYDEPSFERVVKGLENEPERGKRCYQCYLLRLEETAKRAKQDGFDYFATTLTLSPYKNADWLNEIGFMLEKKYAVKYLPSDFKKQGGYLKSIELSKQYGLYRQDYCGCRFSKAEAEKRRLQKDEP